MSAHGSYCVFAARMTGKRGKQVLIKNGAVFPDACRDSGPFTSMFQARSCSGTRPLYFFNRWFSVDANRSVRAKSGPARSLNPESSSGRKKTTGRHRARPVVSPHASHHFDGVQVSNEPLQNLARCDQGHLVSSWNTVS